MDASDDLKERRRHRKRAFWLGAMFSMSCSFIAQGGAPLWVCLAWGLVAGLPLVYMAERGGEK